MLVIGWIIFCCRSDGIEPKEFSQLRVLDVVRELDQLEGQATEKLSFDSPGVKEVEGLIREDIRSNRGRGTVVILSEWDPASMAWEVAAQTILYRRENWGGAPVEEVDLAVMVDLFKATIRKNDRSGDYPQRRGRIGSPYTFRNFHASRLVQAVDGPGASLNVKEVYDNPNKWLDERILSRSGPLPSVINEHKASSRSPEKTRPPKVSSFPEGGEGKGVATSTGDSNMGTLVLLFLAAVIGGGIVSFFAGRGRK